MNKDSTVKKVTRNAGVSIFCKFLTMGFAFIDRFLFIKILGEQYLGINGLYSNILTVLSLADLGINTVFLCFLYEPLVNKDELRLSVLITFFKKAYRLVAGAIFLVGLSLVPFLHLLVNGVDLSTIELVGYYILFLINTSCSYLAVYKSTILVADQAGYITSTIHVVTNISKSILQIAILYFTHSYVLYLVALIVCTLLNNLCLTVISGKRYPFLKNVKLEEDINKQLKFKIFNNVKDVFLYRIGATIINSTDNILISVIVGTAAVGYYSNYSMITINLMSILMIFSQAVMTAWGNFAVNAEKERKELIFRTVMLLYSAIGAFVVGCLVSMMNDFIIFWIRDGQYVLSSFFVWSLSFNIFIAIITSPNWMVRDTTGLFEEARWIVLIAAVINLVLSVILGEILAVEGIILATAIAKLLTIFWYEPKILYKRVFMKPLGLYWSYQTFLICVCVASILASFSLNNFIGESLIEPIGMIVKITICGIVTIGMFVVFSFKSAEFKLIVSKMLRR